VNPLPPAKLKEMRDQEYLAKKMEKIKINKQSFKVTNPEDEAIAKLAEEEMFNNYKPGYRNIQEIDDGDIELNSAKDAFADLTSFRDSLDPPIYSTMTYDEFIKLSNADKSVHLGRDCEIQTIKQSFRGTLWIHNNELTGTFPLKISHLTPILELLGMNTQEHIKSLNDFFKIKMPDGFPVQVEIPIGYLPISAMIKFQNIKACCNSDDSIFDIPKDYSIGEVIGTHSLEQ
jgi:hypothetical protein